jgi:undecaprenyl-diphosphatase
MWQLLILALIQGIVEWLPISSQGQSLIILTNFLGIDTDTALSISLWLHLGTMIAVIYFYRKDYIRAIKGGELESNILRKFLIISTIMTGVVGAPLYIAIREFFPLYLGDFVAVLTGTFLIITGFVIYFSKKSYGEKDVFSLSYIDMVMVGLIQGFAILPGISRSGVTIAFFLILGFKNKSSIRLSFLMSAPAIIGATFFDILISSSPIIYNVDLIILVTVLVLTAIIGLLTIRVLTGLAKKINFAYFCIILGVITIAIALPSIILGGGVDLLATLSNAFFWLYENLRNVILIIGPIGLFLVMIAQAILAPIPSEGILILAGGAFSITYGFPLGIIIVGIVGGLGELGGALIAFYISKFGGRPIAKRLIGEKNLEFADNWFTKYGGWAVLIGRLIPFIPFDAVSYGAGLTKMKVKTFMLATVVGAFPRAFLYAYFGYLIDASISYGGLELFYILLTSIIALVIILVFITRYYIRKKIEEKPQIENNIQTSNGGNPFRLASQP